jgi:membrane protease YdiL (CAAX protease family)
MPDPLPPPTKRRTYALAAFFSLTFLWSWVCWLASSVLKTSDPLASRSVFLLGGFGPTIAALVVMDHRGGHGALQRWLATCSQWRGAGFWMVLGFIFPLFCMLMAAAIHVTLGGTLPHSPATGQWMLVILNFFLVLLVGGPLGEELGWRGFALPILQRRLDWRLASLMLGLLWGLWHLPLFYISGTAQSGMPPWLFMVSAMASSVVFAWLFNRTAGSVLPVLVLHTAVNAWPLVIPVMVMPDGSNLRSFGLVVGILATMALTLMVTTGTEENPYRGQWRDS